VSERSGIVDEARSDRVRALFWVLAIGSTIGISALLGRQAVLDVLPVIALALAAIVGAFLLTRPGYIVYFLALAIPITSGTARGAFVPFFRANEIILLLLTAAAVAIFLIRRRPFRITWLDKLLLVFLAFRILLPVVLSLIRGDAVGGGNIKVLFGPIQYYLLFRVVVECMDKEVQIVRALLCMLGASAVVAIVGVLQALQVPGINEFLATYYPAARDFYTFTFLASPRVTSLFAGDWNGCGLYMAMSVVLGLGTLHLFRKWWQQTMVLIVIFLDLIVVFLTASFSGTAAMVFGLGVLFTSSRQARAYLRPMLYLLPVIITLLATVFWNIVSDRLEMQFGASAESLIPHTWKVRLYLWQEVMWPYISEHWLWGLGTVRLGWNFFESYYVFLILTTGIFGVLAYLGLSVGVLINLSGYRGDTTWRGSIALIAGTFVTQILLANIAGGYFEFSGVTESLWLILGFLIAGEVRGKDFEGIERLDTGVS
jgi:hypothetical protein